MEPDPIRFYLDEHLSPRITKPLARHGIDLSRGAFSVDDQSRLNRARAMQRVFCTKDRDFLRLHAAGVEYAGIVKGLKRHTIGDWV